MSVIEVRRSAIGYDPGLNLNQRGMKDIKQKLDKVHGVTSGEIDEARLKSVVRVGPIITKSSSNPLSLQEK